MAHGVGANNRGDFSVNYEDGYPTLEEVQNDLRPIIVKYGWMAVSDAMYYDPLWKLRQDQRRAYDFSR